VMALAFAFLVVMGVLAVALRFPVLGGILVLVIKRGLKRGFSICDRRRGRMDWALFAQMRWMYV
jgi:hypothetical protein